MFLHYFESLHCKNIVIIQFLLEHFYTVRFSSIAGKTEVELPEVRKNHVDSTFVDVYPFIWNLLEQSGYVTLYAEDQPSLGTWQLRFNGFEQPPTDHYIRPFWQAFHDSEVK